MMIVPFGISTDANAPSPFFGEDRTSKKSLLNIGFGGVGGMERRTSSSAVVTMVDSNQALPAAEIGFGEDGGEESGVGSWALRAW